MVSERSMTPVGGDHTLDKTPQISYSYEVITKFMSNPKPVTLEEYTEVGPEFFAKFNYVKTQLPSETSVEDILTIMETLAGLVFLKRDEDESEDKPAIGFNK